MKLLLGSGGLSTEARKQAWISKMDEFLGSIRNVLFVPYAGGDYDKYVEMIKERGLCAGRDLRGIHEFPSARTAVEQCDSIFVGGGNTFRLLAELYRQDLMPLIRRRVQEGLPYLGISAGSNVAGPTIMTTNDMPITMPPSLEALGLFPYQINPHYFSGRFFFESQGTLIPYAGETRDDRLREFHEMNTTPIIGIYEGSWLSYERRRIALGGDQPRARVFNRGERVREFEGAQDLTGLV